MKVSPARPPSCRGALVGLLDEALNVELGGCECGDSSLPVAALPTRRRATPATTSRRSTLCCAVFIVRKNLGKKHSHTIYLTCSVGASTSREPKTIVALVKLNSHRLYLCCRLHNARSTQMLVKVLRTTKCCGSLAPSPVQPN